MIKISDNIYVNPLVVGKIEFIERSDEFLVKLYSHTMSEIDYAWFFDKDEAEKFLKDAILQIDMANGIRNKNTNTD